MTRAQQLSIVTCVATYVLIVIGGIVRITDSGLGCPDWPLCHGELIPPAEKAVVIEFSHRTAATIVGILIIAMGVLVWREYRDRRIRTLMLAAYPLLALQVILGGITVKRELEAEIVAIHHGTAMVLLALLIVITATIVMHGRSQEVVGRSSPYVRWAAFATAATLALMVSGSYVAASGASLAFPDWPLFDGRLLPEGGQTQGFHALHRVLAAAAGVIILAVAEYTRRTQRHSRMLTSLATIIVAVYAAQVVVGAANIWSNLNEVVAAGHLALGAFIWCILVLLTTLSLYEAAPVRTTAASARGARRGLAHES